MKILKIVGGIVAALVAIILVLPAFLSSRAHVERTIEVKAAPDQTYAFLSDFNQFKKWNPWAKMEPEAKVTVEGSGPNQVYAWEGDKTGQGSMTITGLEPGKQINIKLVFLKPFQDEAQTYWRVEPSTGGSKITWGFDQDLPYFKRIMGLCMDSMLGKDFDNGLKDLKAALETGAP